MEKTGCIIAAVGKSERGEASLSMRRVGSISAIRRIVTTFSLAGVWPIVVTVGENAADLEHELALYSVFFISVGRRDETELLDSVKAGLRFLRQKCARVIFTPANVPLYTAGTVRALLETESAAAAPLYAGKPGHPIIIKEELFDAILSFAGKGGLSAALKEAGVSVTPVETADPGVSYRLTRNDAEDEELVAAHSRQLFHPFLRVRLGKENPFMGGRISMLLRLIRETHSVQQACSYLQLSYSSAWKMLNTLEKELGYPVVERRQGGSGGGKTRLTEKGELFLERYIEYERNVKQYAAAEFTRIFGDGQLPV